MRIRFALALLSALPSLGLLERPVFAQDEPLIGGENPPPAPAPAPAPAPTPPPPPPPRRAAPAPTQPGGNTPRKLKDITDTDHDMVIKSIGMQVVHQLNPITFGGADPNLTLTEIGVRVWLTRTIGLDAGLGLFVYKALPDGSETQVGFGFTGGVPFAIGVYRHVTMFAGPELSVGFIHVADDVNPILLTVRGKAGIELHLGFMDIPRVSLTLGLSLGINMLHVSDNTAIRFGTGDAFSFRGLFETQFGLVFYF